MLAAKKEVSHEEQIWSPDHRGRRAFTVWRGRHHEPAAAPAGDGHAG
jgi:hypothetical protein